MSDEKQYVTNKELDSKLEKVLEKVPSRWEVRSLILGAVVVTNYDVPTEITAAAILAGVVGLVGKSLAVLFRS